MRTKKNILFGFICIMIFPMWSQDVLGKWKTVDDETGEVKSVVEIYEENGKVYGKIIEIYNAEKRDALCEQCEANDYNKPVLGLKIIKEMVNTGDVYKKGTITDPENGKVYDCRLQLDDDPDRLQVRGYVAFFYRTQYWLRVDD